MSTLSKLGGRSSAGRASASQAGCREFESRRPLSTKLYDVRKENIVSEPKLQDPQQNKCEKEKFENQQVSVQYKKKPGCLIKMEVLVSKEAIEASYLKARKEIKKEVSIPGFRKGKAPDDVIEKRFADALDKHFRHLVSDLALKEGLSLIKQRPFTQRSMRKIDIRSIDKTKGAHIFFEFEAAPDVPQIDPQALDLQIVTPRVRTDEDLQAALFNLRILHADKKPLEERALQLQDFAIITLTDLNKPEHPILNKKEMFIGENYCPKWTMEALVGMKKGDTKEVVMPNDDKSETKALLEVNEAFSATLPEVTDEFAVTVHAKDAADLLEKLKKRMTYEAEFEAFEKMRHTVRNELIRLYAFDLPQSLIDGETEGRFRPFVETLKKTKMLESTNLEQAKKEFSDEVKRYFTLLFLLQPLAQKVQMQAAQNEVLEELTHQIMHAPFETRYVYPGLAEEETHQRLLMALILRKCEDWCIEQRLNIKAPKQS